ncbi:hypothetical protein GCM10007420_27230 [Glycocaulis albus]|uniref:Prepilin-type N-terminal cleavage/methylation domain-containing protein n=1 Tax=Glycocaulis albus TaxID=1382801 RepID=A0ABQ1Y1S4_9PROT|nr:hypothetical protein [Glycocaulis albus]GGH08981.1 hypothetical protein GCM10007420_27230 [Glycocaulis albus]
MSHRSGEEGYILLETLIAVGILGAAVLAAGISIANAISVAERAARSAASVNEVRREVVRSQEAARVCASAYAEGCETGASGWVTRPDAAGRVRAAHPPLASRECHFDFVSRQCRPL